MPKLLKRITGIVSLTVVAIAAFWYFEAGYFNDKKVCGEYVSTEPGITRQIWISSDHTYKQKDVVGGDTRRSTGKWHVTTSTGHFWFSSSFVDAPEGARGQDSAEVYATFENWLGFVSVTFNNSELRLNKKLFS